MDELLLRFLRGGTTEAEDAEVHMWLRESPDHEAHLQGLMELLAMAEFHDAQVDPGESPLAQDLIRRADRGRGSRGRITRMRLPAWAMASLKVAAAAALLTLGLAGYGRWVARDDASRLAVEEFMTGFGESATVRMSDGSVVRLGPDSRLQLMSGASSRQVVLVGRAFFAVTPDERHPFKVFTPAGNIRVLGTRFHVEADLADLRLVVVEGSVALATSGSEVQLGAGEMTEVKLGQAGAVQTAPGLAELSSEWMGQFLVFQRTPLVRAAREIEEVYDVEVRILDPTLEEKTLTMWFSSRPLEDVLTVVCSVIDASCTIEGRLISMVARSGERSALP